MQSILRFPATQKLRSLLANKLRICKDVNRMIRTIDQFESLEIMNILWGTQQQTSSICTETTDSHNWISLIAFLLRTGVLYVITYLLNTNRELNGQNEGNFNFM